MLTLGAGLTTIKASRIEDGDHILVKKIFTNKHRRLPHVVAGVANREVKRAHALTFTKEMTASTIDQGLKREINQMKRRITALERAFDSLATKDDLQAIDEAREDLKQGKTMSVVETRKKPVRDIRGLLKHSGYSFERTTNEAVKSEEESRIAFIANSFSTHQAFSRVLQNRIYPYHGPLEPGDQELAQ